MSNPVFNEKFVSNERVLNSEPMTINGAINKTYLLLALLIATSLIVWDFFLKGFSDKVAMLGFVGFIASIISFIVIMFNRKAISIAAPIYAASEGLVIGAISSTIEKTYPGIVIHAVGLTFLCLAVMLGLYRIGAIKCSEKFRSIIFIATFSIAGIYIIDLIGSFFGMHIPQIFTSSSIGIGFSLIVVTIAALNLIIDFDFIEQGATRMLDKTYEWYGAFGLIVTLVWLYIEILNLLAKLRER